MSSHQGSYIGTKLAEEGKVKPSDKQGANIPCVSSQIKCQLCDSLRKNVHDEQDRVFKSNKDPISKSLTAEESIFQNLIDFLDNFPDEKLDAMSDELSDEILYEFLCQLPDELLLEFRDILRDGLLDSKLSEEGRHFEYSHGTNRVSSDENNFQAILNNAVDNYRKMPSQDNFRKFVDLVESLLQEAKEHLDKLRDGADRQM
ncbi:hypothetical protein JR316_0007546 [Psilocybe cubensis]|uniref:Uncharacterized protein n=1 Tax=Psilocybe cubensis TaxID=181762 RepID=A0ACB8GZC5_PSICU|nr:hypothetical protein JR316_0007546 [Psilocybe cubensis]KAH9480939.1 hypothetical protein JR316_0007546 [Psilocybe cubensis]